MRNALLADGNRTNLVRHFRAHSQQNANPLSKGSRETEPGGEHGKSEPILRRGPSAERGRRARERAQNDGQDTAGTRCPSSVPVPYRTAMQDSIAVGLSPLQLSALTT